MFYLERKEQLVSFCTKKKKESKQNKIYFIGSLDPNVFYYDFTFSEHTCEIKREEKKTIQIILSDAYIYIYKESTQ
jgi:hypothetical protein